MSLSCVRWELCPGGESGFFLGSFEFAPQNRAKIAPGQVVWQLSWVHYSSCSHLLNRAHESNSEEVQECKDKPS